MNFITALFGSPKKSAKKSKPKSFANKSIKYKKTPPTIRRLLLR